MDGSLCTLTVVTIIAFAAVATISTGYFSAFRCTKLPIADTAESIKVARSAPEAERF
jgi:hypothetical protein